MHNKLKTQAGCRGAVQIPLVRGGCHQVDAVWMSLEISPSSVVDVTGAVEMSHTVKSYNLLEF